MTRLVDDGVLYQISKGIFIIGDTELSNKEIILKHYLIDYFVIIKGMPAKEYLLSTLELTSKKNVEVTIYSNETFSNKNICGIKVLASKDSYALVIRELAILLELIHCESIIEEDYEVVWVYRIYELGKSYKDCNFSKKHMFYPRKVYIRLANLLESMHISNRVMENINLRRNYSFFKIIKRFKIYIKYNVSEARRFAVSCDSSPLFFDRNIEEYLDALEVIEVDDNFNSLLNEQEKKVLSYYRYHNSDNTKPKNYEKHFMNSYDKWLKVLPKKEIKMSAFKLGKATRIIRIKNDMTITSLATLMGVDRNTISQYEKDIGYLR